MKTIFKFFFFSILALTIANCTGSPLRTSLQAERNRMNMIDIKKGMNAQEVRAILGAPFKIEKRTFENSYYEIFYYLTEGVNMDQTRYINKNFTPFVFKNYALTGWGWAHYNYVFDVGNARFKKMEEVRQKYTNDKEEWPSNEHKIITPFGDENNEGKSTEKNLQEFVKPKTQTAPPDQVPSNQEVSPPSYNVPQDNIIEETPKAPNEETPNEADKKIEQAIEQKDGVEKKAEPQNNLNEKGQTDQKSDKSLPEEPKQEKSNENTRGSNRWW